tara:strand:- start:42 stop:470 length:429 start_codon:yes stop_codon:yes gene_type:complete
MNLKKVNLEETCNGMTCEFSTQNLRDTHLIDTLYIKFSGEYRYGSAGKSELGFMIGNYELGMNVWRPFKTIIDISNVTYEWGDDMDLLLDISDRKSSVMIVGDKNRRAISTLAFGMETERDIVDNKYFFDKLEKGIEKLNRK